jgi:hypothetical protein
MDPTTTNLGRESIVNQTRNPINDGHKVSFHNNSMLFGTVLHRTLLIGGAIFATLAFMVSWWRTGGNFALKAANAWVLVGGVSDTSATFRIYNGASLILSTTVVDDSITNPVFVWVLNSTTTSNQTTTKDEDFNVISVDVTNGLTANTRYYYQLVTQTNDRLNGSIRTSVPNGIRFNFTIAAAGCAWTGSRSSMFTQLLSRRKDDNDDDASLLFMLQLGDFHYEDIGRNDAQLRTNAVSKALGSPEQAQFYRHTPLVYMWDDHDVCRFWKAA